MSAIGGESRVFIRGQLADLNSSRDRNRRWPQDRRHVQRAQMFEGAMHISKIPVSYAICTNETLRGSSLWGCEGYWTKASRQAGRKNLAPTRPACA